MQDVKDKDGLVANKDVFDSILGKAITPIKIDEKLSAKYSGKLPIGGVELDCAVLSDNTRIISSSSVFKAFDKSRKGEYRVTLEDGTKLPPFIGAKYLIQYINQDLLRWTTSPIKYIDGTVEKEGYSAEILPELCELYLRVRRENQTTLTENQRKMADQAEILLGSFAKIGIVALIDEATGFQYDRKHDALRILIQQYIADGIQKWLKTFPDEFFMELDRLYKNEKTTSRKRPQYYGIFINKYIYEPIEKGYIKNKLDELNIKDDGTRKARFHQWLSQHGKDVLIKQIWRILGIMEISSSINAFKNRIDKQKMISVAPYLFDEYNNID